MDCKFVFTLFWRTKFWLCSVVASFAFDVVAAVAVQVEIALVIEHDALVSLCTVLLLAYLQGPALLFLEETQWYRYHIPP